MAARTFRTAKWRRPERTFRTEFPVPPSLSQPLPVTFNPFPVYPSLSQSIPVQAMFRTARLGAVFGGSPLSSGGSPKVLEGKVALVTAGTDGIGLAVAEALGVAGAQVFLSSRRQHNVDRAVAHLRGRGLQVSGVTCHVGRAEERERMVQAALDTFGAIDILVSNAAVNPHLGPALEADESTWDKVFQVNVTAAAMLVRLVVPHMERRGGGAIVLMSSIAGYRPMAGLGPYSVSKSALLGLVAALSPELLPRGIRINGVAPGLIQTRFSQALWQDEAVRDRALQELGVQRLGTPPEVGGAVLFLVSPSPSQYIPV
ncbi:dehydrogenase/reductase SDR family member 4-like isoform X2 [Catharus ustulatus]|uniref:dehydrogenase/reductase SDR family member 4-like isoform X2 n=1 Tax=Catharus ustulatus TaxID=91951 RepID=UPI0014084FA1|nr:dehydrogenase/reductase SDR family member 4-like isoform X2 [Catharus ustulatus]